MNKKCNAHATDKVGERSVILIQVKVKFDIRIQVVVIRMGPGVITVGNSTSFYSYLVARFHYVILNTEN